MLIHNPHRHSSRCVALGETLDAFETRQVPAELEKRVRACGEQCSCTVMDDKPARGKTAE